MRPESETGPLFCHRCACELMPGRVNYYRVTIEAVADPAPPELSPEDLTQDLEQQIRQLLARMQNISEREALDQVYRREQLYLCYPCYRIWIENPTG